jgi:hypothetical protein
MKEPKKPNKPCKPTEPRETYKSTESTNITLYDGMSLQDVINQANLFGVDLNSVKFYEDKDYGYNGEAYFTARFMVAKEVILENKKYKAEYAHYLKKLEKYDQEMAQYKENLKEYNKLKLEYDNFQTQKAVENAKSVLKKAGYKI